VVGSKKKGNPDHSAHDANTLYSVTTKPHCKTSDLIEYQSKLPLKNTNLTLLFWERVSLSFFLSLLFNSLSDDIRNISGPYTRKPLETTRMVRGTTLTSIVLYTLKPPHYLRGRQCHHGFYHSLLVRRLTLGFPRTDKGFNPNTSERVLSPEHSALEEHLTS
jgi:hypothetical protein